VAAAENASQKPASSSTSRDITPAASSTTTSVTGAQFHHGHQFYENIDPTLRPTNYGTRDEPRMGSEVETPPTDEGEESDIDDSDDEGSQDEQFGWGTAHGRHSVHPGR